jgi:hypothetical protein
MSFTSMLMRRHACDMQVYTFAGPRVGDLEFVAFTGNCYEGHIFRIVHSSDLVPKVGSTLVYKPACWASTQPTLHAA